MKRNWISSRTTEFSLLAAVFLAALPCTAATQTKSNTGPKAESVPSGAWITPTAAPGARFANLKAGVPGHSAHTVDEAETTVTSP
ncbi:MAG: hypothetical protein ACRD5L_02150, partial [Bryobacteraceae bacterium]